MSRSATADEPAVQSPSNGGNKTEQTFNLIALPTEIRLQIYGELLLSRRPDYHDEPPTFEYDLSVKDTDLWAIWISKYSRKTSSEPYQHSSLHPSILRASKQIYYEASPILYSGNVFMVINSFGMERLMDLFGAKNMARIRTLFIWLPRIWTTRKEAWLASALERLAREATGLQRIEVSCAVDCNLVDYSDTDRVLNLMGQGHSVAIVRALAGFQGLSEIRLVGYYGKHWPSYLEKKMDATVVKAERTYPVRFQLLDTTYGGYDTKEWKCQHNGQCFVRYEEATESIFP
ncbi:hypothetical protein B0T22DRAFT_299746 [Podospora appendiculata]|uniref:DUF7730 domain-containing protein n=1 Tax=Podospora appendiculata TaxID=314037 RepID=A0AAE0WZV1_9PEZI|nr:hypothetical protein B0T22DRAFT_299746 [Podospora appendiculata]